MRILLIVLYLLISTLLLGADEQHTAHEKILNSQVEDMKGFVDLIKWAASGIVGGMVLAVLALWARYNKATHKYSELLLSLSDDRVDAMEERQKTLMAVSRILKNTNERNEQLSKVVSALVRSQNKLKDKVESLLNRIRR